MKKFKPTKKLLRLLERQNQILEQAEWIIKERIAKICKKYGAEYSCYSSTFRCDSVEGGKLENEETRLVREAIDWYESNMAHFDPQNFCNEEGEWTGRQPRKPIQ